MFATVAQIFSAAAVVRWCGGAVVRRCFACVYLSLISGTLLFTKQFALAAEKVAAEDSAQIVWPANYAPAPKSICLYHLYKYKSCRPTGQQPASTLSQYMCKWFS